MRRKWKLCESMVKGVLHLLSWDFWKAGIGLGFPRCFAIWALLIWATVASELRDLISLILVPDYPPKPEKIEYNGKVTYFPD